MSLYRSTTALFLLCLIVYILNVSKSYLIPFVLALLIWFVIKSLRTAIRRNAFIRAKVPAWIQNSLVYLLIFGGLFILSSILTGSVQDFSGSVDGYQQNIQKIIDNIQAKFDINLSDRIQSYIDNFNFTGIVQSLLNSLTTIIGDGFIITLYTIFLLLEESIFRKKIQLLFKDPEDYLFTKSILQDIDESFSRYIILKSTVSLLTGVLSFLVLYFLGIDSPGLWALLIFLFNFIPSVGSIIATIFPVLIAMLQFGEIMPGIWVLFGVGGVQLLVGNVIEPRVMGNSLNISPLVVIISLILWGAIWGIVGMILSVPITAMLIIILGQFDSTRGIAIMLSANGEIFHKPHEEEPIIEAHDDTIETQES